MGLQESLSALRASIRRGPRTDIPADRLETAGNAPRGLRVLPGFASEADLGAITAWVAAHVRWSGGTMHGNRMQTWLATGGPLPPWGSDLAQRMADAGIFRDAPDYLHLIHYKAGSGIPSHVDREIFQDVVAGLTLKSSRVMEFTHPTRPLVRVLLLPGDLYVISGEARHKWRHGVPPQLVDRFHGRDLVRTEGLSATWRGMVPGAL
jgi:alkylated DNA repair dioxygenase AlkB